MGKNKTLLISNILAAGFLFISCFSCYVDPIDFWPIAILGLAFPFLVVINVCFVIYWSVRCNLKALISIIGLVGSSFTSLRYWSFQPQSPLLINKTPRTLRVMNYNVRSFDGVGRYAGVKTDTAILRLIISKQPDILAFEEFNIRNSRFRFCDSLQGKLGANLYFQPFIEMPYDTTGLAIFTRLPIVKKGIIYLSALNSENQGIFVDLETAKGRLRVYCFHLQSIMINHWDLRLYNLKSVKSLMTKIKQAYISRSYETQVIETSLKSCPYPFIILGDFNDTPNSFAVNKIAKGLHNAFQEKGSGLGVTFNQTLPIFQIDYILSSSNLKTLTFEIPHRKISDHYPVVSDILFK